jgi:hypothetical protein
VSRPCCASYPFKCLYGRRVRFRLLSIVSLDSLPSCPPNRFCLDADIVCTRAKNHYDPQGNVDFSDSATQLDDGQATTTLEAFKRGFRPLHQNMTTVMYFS